jgi:hypothetical protein
VAETMYKVQQLDPDHGWTFATRAGQRIDDAIIVLLGYRRDYPSVEHRLVEINDAGQIVSIIGSQK